MILRSLTVQGWKCFANAVSVGPLVDTINVIQAPNGTGKSTLFQAMTRALFDSHKVTGEIIERVRPWGRDLAPSVTVEFCLKGTEYQLIKKFLNDREARLLRKEDGRWVSLAESDAANDQVRAMFAGEAPGRGATDVRHWGLGQILWAGQGALPLVTPSEPVLVAIKRSLGVQVAGQEMSALEARIQDAYDQVFSPGGEYRRGRQAPEVIRLRARLTEVHVTIQTLQAQVQAFEEASRRVEDLRSRHAQAERNLAGLTDNLGRARDQAKAYDHAVGEHRTCQAGEQAAKAEYENLKQRVDGIAAARSKRGVILQEVVRLKTDLDPLKGDLASAQVNLDKAKVRQQAVNQRRIKVAASTEMLDMARQFVEARKAVEETTKSIRTAERLQDTIEKLTKQLAQQVAPDKRTLNAIRKAMAEESETSTRLDASLIHLEITPEVAGKLKVITGEPTGQVQLKPTKTVAVAGSPEVLVDMMGIGRIRAYGPARSVEEDRKDLAKARAEVQRLTRPFGTTDLTKLESLYDEVAQKQKDIETQTAKLEGILGDNSLISSRQTLTRQAALVEAILKGHPTWDEKPPDLDVVRQEAKEAERKFSVDLEEAQASVDQNQQALTRATQQLATTEQQIAAKEAEQNQLEQQVQELEGDGRDGASRKEELDKMALTWHAATRALAVANQAVKAFPQNPNVEVQTLEKQVERLRSQADTSRDQERIALGRLQQMADAGVYSQVSELANEIESLEADIRRHELHLGAIKLLHDLLEQRHREIAIAVTKPVADKASRLMQRIAGPRLGSVHLNDTFQPAGLVTGAASTPVFMEDLSGGESEQIHLAVRLALADQMAAGERELLVLDDVLTATDSGRLARIQTILGEFAHRFQIVILTCHPERYGGLEGANMIDLEAIVGR